MKKSSILAAFALSAAVIVAVPQAHADDDGRWGAAAWGFVVGSALAAPGIGYERGPVVVYQAPRRVVLRPEHDYYEHPRHIYVRSQRYRHYHADRDEGRHWRHEHRQWDRHHDRHRRGDYR